MYVKLSSQRIGKASALEHLQAVERKGKSTPQSLLVINNVRTKDLWRLFWKIPRQWVGGMSVLPQRIPITEIKMYLDVNNYELEGGELDVLLAMDVAFINGFLEQQEKQK